MASNVRSPIEILKREDYGLIVVAGQEVNAQSIL